MSRIPMLPLDPGSSAGIATNLHRILGYNPALLAAWRNLARVMRDECESPRELRELLTLRVASLSPSDYMWHEHLTPASAAGVSKEQIRELADWRKRTDLFTAAERCTLKLAEEVSEGNVTNATMTEALSLFRPQEIVELLFEASIYGAIPRFTQALGIGFED